MLSRAIVLFVYDCHLSGVDMHQRYTLQGFTVVENFFTPEEMEPCRKTLQKMVDDVAQKLYKTGRIKSTILV